MSLCQTNPLNSLVSKSRFHYTHTGQTVQGQQVKQVQNSSLDQQYSQFAFGRNEAGLPGHQPHYNISNAGSMARQSVAGPRAMGNEQGWVDQFANMQVRDNTEFSDEYKRMYSQYEKPQNNMHMRPMLSSNASMAVSLPLVQQHRPQFQQEQMQAFNSQHNDAYLQQQFMELERDLEQQTSEFEQKPGSESESVEVLDEDQKELQRAAQSIYNTLSDSSPDPSKFARSKFLGLMRNISDGVVTLKKDPTHDKYTELRCV